ncbi:MAG: SGNH/GDSL hydrolase family protein [Planctomycetota bacterium]|nr:SGNH/GDSL hydrolase family protein [Planctomycetota bacterium]
MQPFSTLVCCTVFVLLGACGGLGNPGPRHVLILGDSISIGYTKTVQEILGPDFKVVRPMHKDGKRMENCAGTTNGVSAIDRWLALDGGPWDVIHFNFGLHDLKRVDAQSRKNSDDPSSPPQADIATYSKQLTNITDKLEASGARLIFATTTPVPPGKVRPHRDPKDVELYNAAARSIMIPRQIAIDDLYTFALPLLAEIQLPVNVHFTPEGSVALAHEVASSIQAATTN